MPHASITVLRPTDGSRLADYPIADAATVQQQVHAARLAWPALRTTSLTQRQHLLRDIARRLEAETDRIADILCAETGKPRWVAIELDINPAIQALEVYARQGLTVLSAHTPPLDWSIWLGRTHRVHAAPRGVVGIIAPWNFPVGIAANGLAAALMSGNAAILKPSELTPGCGQLLVDLIQAVLLAHGLPTDLVTCAVGDATTGQALVAADIDYVIFTGSTTTGLTIQTQLAPRNIPCSLEMGGSCPAIILPTARNLNAVADHIVWSRFVNSGQACAGIKRCFVPNGLHNVFVGLFAHKMEALRLGPPEDPETVIGPLISAQQRNRIADQVADAMAHGATLITGGVTPEGPGWYYPPTLLTHSSPESRVLQEETFGPVLPVIAYTTVEEAIEKANASPFGLSASVFGPTSQAEHVATQLAADVVAINDAAMTGYGYPAVRWHGRRHSGAGAGSGAELLHALSHRQTRTINRGWWVPILRKPPWLLDRGAHAVRFSKALIGFMRHAPLAGKSTCALLAGFWRHYRR